MALPFPEQLARDLAAGELSSTRALFASHDSLPPRIVWSPVEADLPHEPLRFLLRYWTEKRGPSAAPLTTSINPLEMVPALGFIMLLDVIEGGIDFRYRLYGTGIVERTGKDWTGKTVSDMAGSAFTALFYGAVYRASLARRLPVATVSTSPRHVAAQDWSRIVLPLVDSTGGIVRFLVGNVPGAWRRPE